MPSVLLKPYYQNSGNTKTEQKKAICVFLIYLALHNVQFVEDEYGKGF